MILKRKVNNMVSNTYQFHPNQATPEPKELVRTKRINIISGSEVSAQKQSLPRKTKQDLEIVRYPLLQYFIGISIFAFTIYIFASIAGIPWGIPTFNQKQWWHFVVGGVSFAFSIGITFNADCQTFLMVKSSDLLFHCTYKFFCLFENKQSHKISSIVNIQLVEQGTAKKVSLHSRWYGSQISFIDCKKITVLKCISEENAQLYMKAIIGFVNVDIKARIQMMQKLRT